MQMTCAESAELARIRNLVRHGLAVLPDEKQWVLNIVARERLQIPQEVKDSAAKQGYNVAQVLTC